MHRRLQTMGALAGLSLVLAAFGLPWYGARLTSDSLQLTITDAILRRWVEAQEQPGAREWQHAVEALRKRARIYEDQIQASHLLEGMVVNRRLHDGMHLGECDSLLFSSLRYAALRKLGWHKEAQAAWQALARSEVQGEWFRHPSCRHGTSRDMLTGFLVGLSQQPPGVDLHLTRLLEFIDLNNGFFGRGPFYLSLLSPNLAELLRRLALADGMPAANLPISLRWGFSTLEWNGLIAKRGYTSHLTGLHTWLEFELAGNQQGAQPSSRSPTLGFDKALSAYTYEPLYEQRLRWVSLQLTALDPPNLFFRWLRLRSSNLLTRAERLDLMSELLTMPQFPPDRLPQNCQRTADYLWQRDSEEYKAGNRCTVQFSGVDFLWMAALLINDGSDGSRLTSVALPRDERQANSSK